MEFSTNDQDNDGYYFQCSRSYKGAWWYKSCHQSKLNGLYLNGSHLSNADGVNWLSFRGHRYSLKRTKMKVKTIAWDNVYPRIKRQSNQGFTFPQATHGHLTVVLSGGWGTWTLYGCGGLFEPDLSSSFSGIHVFYLLIWSCLKVKSSLSRADPSQEKVSKKVTVADLAFYKQIDHQIRHLGRAFEHRF